MTPQQQAQEAAKDFVHKEWPGKPDNNRVKSVAGERRAVGRKAFVAGAEFAFALKDAEKEHHAASLNGRIEAYLDEKFSAKEEAPVSTAHPFATNEMIAEQSLEYQDGNYEQDENVRMAYRDGAKWMRDILTAKTKQIPAPVSGDMVQRIEEVMNHWFVSYRTEYYDHIRKSAAQECAQILASEIQSLQEALTKRNREIIGLQAQLKASYPPANAQRLAISFAKWVDGNRFAMDTDTKEKWTLVYGDPKDESFINSAELYSLFHKENPSIAHVAAEHAAQSPVSGRQRYERISVLVAQPSSEGMYHAYDLNDSTATVYFDGSNWYPENINEVVAWLRPVTPSPDAEKAALVEEEWISVNDKSPREGGRYWCYVEETNSLGKSHYQWNCAFNESTDEFSDGLVRLNVTHWMPLPDPPALHDSTQTK